MAFGLLRGGFLAPRLAALSPAISPAAPNEPLQIHLAYGNDPTAMVAQWTTRDSAAPAVRWGPVPGAPDRSAPASTGGYTQEELCGEPATSVRCGCCCRRRVCRPRRPSAAPAALSLALALALLLLP